MTSLIISRDLPVPHFATFCFFRRGGATPHPSSVSPSTTLRYSSHPLSYRLAIARVSVSVVASTLSCVWSVCGLIFSSFLLTPSMHTLVRSFSQLLLHARIRSLSLSLSSSLLCTRSFILYLSLTSLFVGILLVSVVCRSPVFPTITIRSHLASKSAFSLLLLFPSPPLAYADRRHTHVPRRQLVFISLHVIEECAPLTGRLFRGSSRLLLRSELGRITTQFSPRGGSRPRRLASHGFVVCLVAGRLGGDAERWSHPRLRDAAQHVASRITVQS
jgi:hypothetical protein